jgi:hypothetical protein
MAKHIILMADVIKSRKTDARAIAGGLKLLVQSVNKKNKKDILSPLTITLGDEFQSVVKDIRAGIKIILFIEEYIIQNNIGFKLRYVLLSGKIETPVNHKIAYGMIGEGLTKARETINYLKKSGDRFHFITDNNRSDLNYLFVFYQSVVDEWKQKDFKLISDFIRLDDYKLVAMENKRSPSLMWKKRKSLKIKEYKVIKKYLSEKYGLE